MNLRSFIAIALALVIPAFGDETRVSKKGGSGKGGSGSGMSSGKGGSGKGGFDSAMSSGKGESGCGMSSKKAGSGKGGSGKGGSGKGGSGKGGSGKGGSGKGGSGSGMSSGKGGSGKGGSGKGGSMSSGKGGSGCGMSSGKGGYGSGMSSGKGGSLPDVPAEQSEAGSQGDPHFKTWRNEHFEYHGQCDLVLAKVPNFAEDLGMDIQIRTKLVRFWSYIKSVAVRIGNDVFEVEGDAEGTVELRYWMNMELQGPLETIGGFPVIFNGRDNNANKKIIQIDLSSKYPGSMIEIQVWKEFVKVDFKNPTVEAFGNAVGMLGDFKTGVTLARDGVTEIDDFHQFGNEWQVLPTDLMMFHKAETPQFPKKCIEPEDPRGERRRRLEESSVSFKDAEKACSSLTDELDRKDCVYDIVATQDIDMAGAY